MTDLSLILSPTTNVQISVNGTRAFVVTVTNSSSSSVAANNVQVVLGRASSVTTVGTPIASQGSLSGNIWSVGSLAIGASVTLNITLKYTAKGLMGFFAALSGSVDAVTTNNFQVVYTTVNKLSTSSSLVVNYTPGTQQLTVNNALTLTITVSNGGATSVTGLALYFPLPTGVTVQSSTPSQGSIAGSVWTIGSIAQNGKATVQVSMLFGQVGVFALGALVVNNTNDTTPSNHAAVSFISVAPPFIPPLVKTFIVSPNPINPGGTCNVHYSKTGLATTATVLFYMNGTLIFSDILSSRIAKNKHIVAPTTVGTYVATVVMINIATLLSDSVTHHLYVGQPTYPSDLSNVSSLVFTPTASGAVVISAALSDLANLVIHGHTVCPHPQIQINTSSAVLAAFLSRSDLGSDSAADQIRQMLTGSYLTTI